MSNNILSSRFFYLPTDKYPEWGASTILLPLNVYPINQVKKDCNPPQYYARNLAKNVREGIDVFV